MRYFAFLVFAMSLSAVSGATFAIAECAQHDINDDQQSASTEHSGEIAAVLRTIEKDGKIYDCTLFASGEKCVVIDVVEPAPKKPVRSGD